jgi:hypothetical protein
MRHVPVVVAPSDLIDDGSSQLPLFRRRHLSIWVRGPIKAREELLELMVRVLLEELSIAVVN